MMGMSSIIFVSCSVLSSLYYGHALLINGNSGNLGIDDLYKMIQQQNITIQRLLERESKAVGFFARLTKDIAHLGDGQTIEFDTVVTNEGNAYDPRHDHFIAPVAGLYQISVSIMSTPNTYIHCMIVKNDVGISALYGATTDYDSDTQVIVLDLQAGDMVWVKHSGDASEKINLYNSYFSGFLIKQHL